MVVGRATVPRNCFWVEVSETVVMENPEQIVESLASLKSAGANIALDEFGSGYSSVAYLHRLPLDVIKIDRSLVRSANATGADPVVLRSVLAMARELGLDVVVQGVDRERDAAYLRALGCEFGQGFFFGEPMTEKEVVALVGALSRAASKAGGDRRSGATGKQAGAARERTARPGAPKAPERRPMAAPGLAQPSDERAGSSSDNGFATPLRPPARAGGADDRPGVRPGRLGSSISDDPVPRLPLTDDDGFFSDAPPERPDDAPRPPRRAERPFRGRN